MNCSIRSELAQLKATQRDVRPLHPEDMKKNEFLVRKTFLKAFYLIQSKSQMCCFDMDIKNVPAELQLLLVCGGRVSNPATTEGADSRYSRY